ncbi:hypothetical protein Tco_0261817 [Tanacetum coccineum]
MVQQGQNQIVKDLQMIVEKHPMLEMIMDESLMIKHESLEMLVDDSLEMIEDESLDMIVDETLEMIEDESLEMIEDESLDMITGESLKLDEILSRLSDVVVRNLDDLSFDELANVYEIHASHAAMVGNMLANESRILSKEHTHLKNDIISLKNKNGGLRHEVSKLEDSLSKAQNNQDVEGSQVVKNLRSENARVSEELLLLMEVAASAEDSRKILFEELDRESLLSKESNLREEVEALSSKLKIVDLERAELKATTFGWTQAPNEVHGLGSSWDFKDIEDYNPEAKKFFDDVAEAFYKLEFPYISLLVEKAGQSPGLLAAVDPPTIQEAISAPL